MSAMRDHEAFESQILTFERAWQQGVPQEIEAALSAAGVKSQPERLRLLIELICIDLEFSWRKAAEQGGPMAPAKLDDYVCRFADFDSLDTVPLELVGEEYRVRQQWGDRPGQTAFLARFSRRRDQIRELLDQIDRELRHEADEAAGEPNLSKSIQPSESQAAALDARPDPAAPLSYADYLLQKLIGAGGTGRVYRAWQRSLGRPVAVKYLRKSFLNQSAAVARFIAEAQTVARLQHPGIVGVHGLGRTPIGGYFLVMDFIDGPDLARLLDAGLISVEQAVRWTVEACEAVEHAHERGIVHCDLKPANLVLGRDGCVRLTDFGLARSLADDRRLNADIEGTAAFMAPEQVSRFWGPIGTQTDVYGLGAVLYALLTGRPPHQGRRLADVLANVISPVSPIAPNAIRPEIPQELSQVCLQCLARVPHERYASVEDLRAALMP
jgi:eukaryotic-like serine/threonine-protein kinase